MRGAVRGQCRRACRLGVRKGASTGVILAVSVAVLCSSVLVVRAPLDFAQGPNVGTASGPTPFVSGPVLVATIPHPVGLAATSSELLATLWGDLTVFSVRSNGSVHPFATVPSLDPNASIMGIAISPGFAGFPLNEVFVGQGPYIFEISPHGTSVALFATLPSEDGVDPGTAVPTGLAFDMTGSFGFQLVVTGGDSGSVLTLNSTGGVSFITIGEAPIYGPAVTPWSFGLSGDLLVAGSFGEVLEIAPNGEEFEFGLWDGASSVAVIPDHPCGFGGSGHDYFFADNSSNEIETIPAAVTAGPDQAYITSAYSEVPSGIGNLSTFGGDANPFYSTSDVLYSSTWASCPVFGAVTTISHGSWYPYEMGYDPLTKDMYVTNYSGHEVFFVDRHSHVIGQATVGTDPAGVVYDPLNHEMLVANSGSNSVSIFDASTNTVIASVPVGTDPQGLAFDPRNGEVYVANNGSNNLSMIDSANQALLSAPTDPGPFGVAFDPGNGYIYTADLSGNVSVINGTTKIATFTLNGPATGIARNPKTGARMFATVFGDSAVAEVGGPKLLKYLPAGLAPFGIAYDPKDGDLFVSDHGSGTLTILRGTATIVETVFVGEGPWGVAYDPANGLIYVAGVLQGDPRVIIGGGG